MATHTRPAAVIRHGPRWPGDIVALPFAAASSNAVTIRSANISEASMTEFWVAIIIGGITLYSVCRHLERRINDLAERVRKLEGDAA